MLRRFLIHVAVLAATGAMAQSQLDPSRTVLVVNNDKILAGSFYRRMENLPNVGRMVGNRFVSASPGFLTLQQMINEALMIQLAREKGVAPTKAELDDELARAAADVPEMMASNRSLGFTDEEIRRTFEVTLSEFKVTSMGINITNQEVDKFYKENPTLYTNPRRFKLRVIAVKDEAGIRKVDDELAKGTAFAEVAKMYSEEASKADGGLYGEIVEDQLGAKLKPEVLKLKKGGMTPWAQSQDSFYKFFVEEIFDAKVLPLDDRLRRDIRRGLMIDRGQVKNNVGEMMKEMRMKVKFTFQGTPYDKQIAELYKLG